MQSLYNEIEITFGSVNPNVNPNIDDIKSSTCLFRNNEHIENLQGFKINFILNNKNITKEFIKVWKNSKSSVWNPLSEKNNKETNPNDVNSYLDNKICNMHYNVYEYKNTILIKKEINKVICALENRGHSIDKNLMLDESSYTIEFYKLNCLHEYFEDTTKENQDREENLDKDTFILLEKINHYVHSLENPSSTNRIFISVRKITSNKHFKYPLYQLIDDDYNTFEVIKSGYLYLDYATVGKDLHCCWMTNDLELVAKKKVSPQLYCNPNFQFGFSELDDKSKFSKKYTRQWHLRRYYNWCKDNNIEQFYDYKLPIHNLGRALLGTLKEHMTYKYFLDQLKKYPYIINIRLI